MKPIHSISLVRHLNRESKLEAWVTKIHEWRIGVGYHSQTQWVKVVYTQTQVGILLNSFFAALDWLNGIS